MIYFTVINRFCLNSLAMPRPYILIFKYKFVLVISGSLSCRKAVWQSSHDFGGCDSDVRDSGRC
jgi:hypothetical protein